MHLPELKVKYSQELQTNGICGVDDVDEVDAFDIDDVLDTDQEQLPRWLEARRRSVDLQAEEQAMMAYKAGVEVEDLSI